MQPGSTSHRAPGQWPAARATLGALPVVVAACLLLGCGGGSGDRRDGAGEERPPAVEALPARSGSLPLEDVLSGVVRARNQVAIRPEISAPVVEVLARNGDLVEAGQPLVRLDDSTLREQLRQAEASLRLAKATAAEARARETEVAAQVTRTRALAAQRLVSELELETREAQLEAARAQAAQAEARVEQAAATVDERRSALARTVVRAPAAGRVGQRDAEVGMVADSSSPLFLLGDFEELVVEVPLTQEMLRHVEVGTAVEIDAGRDAGAGVRATVSRISPFLEQSSFSTTAEIDVAGRGDVLRPGMFVAVRVLYGESERATLLPASALWGDPHTGGQVVFVVEDAADLAEPASTVTDIPEDVHTISVRPVDVRAEGRGRVGVAGVEEGEWVVTLGQQLLLERLGSAGVDSTTARVRATTWERVLELQGLQREDLLEEFLARQRLVAAELGAELPADQAVVDEVLQRAEAEATASPGRAAASGTPGGG